MAKIDLQKIISWTKGKHAIAALLLTVVFLSAGLRLYHLGANPFVADEFLDINSSYGYFKTHVWQAWDFNLGTPNTQDVFAPRDERAWLYKWQVAQIFRFLPLSEAAARLASVFWGILSVFIIYWAAKSFTKNKSIGLLSAFLFAVSATAIAFDRKLRMYSMFFPLYLLLSLFLFQFLEADYAGKIRLVKYFHRKFKVNILYVLPVIFIGLASFFIQLLTINILPVLGIYISVQAAIRARQKDYLNKYSIILALGVLGTIVAILLAAQSIIYYSGVLKFFINNYAYLFDIFRDYSSWILAAALLASGVYFFFKEKLTKEGWWLALSFFVPLLMAAFLWKRAQGIQYVFFLQSFLIILIATGIYFWAKFFENNLPDTSKKYFFAAIILALLILPDYSYFFSGGDTTYHRDNAQIGDYRKVFIYVHKNLKPGEVIITRHFRNYYLQGADVPIFDFGGERAEHKLSLADIQQVQSQNPHGWIVLFDNDSDFIAKEGLNYIRYNFTKVDTSQIRGASDAYRW